MNHLVFQNLLRDICRRLNISDAKAVIDGQPLQFHGMEFHFSVKRHGSDDLFVFVAQLGCVSPQTPADMYRDMLEMNLSMQIHGHLCFAIDPDSQALLLIHQTPFHSANSHDIALIIHSIRQIAVDLAHHVTNDALEPV